MRTIVYIDGFNLYFGCLKDTSYKWLDIEKLLLRLCKEQDPKSDVIAIKYFTAEISPNLSPHGQRSYEAQRDYLLALEKHSQRVEIIRGKFFICSSSLYPREPNTKSPTSFDSKVDVWRPEEKQTDVNIAIEMLCDAQDSKCEQQVLVTNDSDLSTLLKRLKERHPSVIQGVISPIKHVFAEKQRRPSSELRKSLDWIREKITDEELMSSSLPAFVLTRKRKISKPGHW